MKKPVLQNDAFLADVEEARREPDRLHLWWLGQSGFLIQWHGRHVLLDPYLSDSLTLKYAATEKPHVRMTERVIAPDRLAFVDIITSSHNHTDHLDADTIRPILDRNPGLAMVVGAANVRFAADRLKVSPERLTVMGADSPLHVPPFTFYAVPSAHESVEIDENGQPRHIGLVLKAGSWTLYHSGDTVAYPGMVEGLKQWRIDGALLPINGRDARRRVPGNLSGPEAAQLAHDIGAGLVVPCHYDMFEFNTASPKDFVRAAKAAAQPYRVLQNGERLTL